MRASVLCVRGAYKDGALRRDREAARMSEHGLLALAVPAAARSRTSKHREHAVLKLADTVVSRVRDVCAAICADCEAARVEEGGAAAWKVNCLGRRRHGALEHFDWRRGHVAGCTRREKAPSEAGRWWDQKEYETAPGAQILCFPKSRAEPPRTRSRKKAHTKLRAAASGRWAGAACGARGACVVRDERRKGCSIRRLPGFGGS